ncbi:unnamed protein product, partial [Owenia fusiformis]
RFTTRVVRGCSRSYRHTTFTGTFSNAGVCALGPLTSNSAMGEKTTSNGGGSSLYRTCQVLYGHPFPGAVDSTNVYPVMNVNYNTSLHMPIVPSGSSSRVLYF